MKLVHPMVTLFALTMVGFLHGHATPYYYVPSSEIRDQRYKNMKPPKQPALEVEDDGAVRVSKDDSNVFGDRDDLDDLDNLDADEDKAWWEDTMEDLGLSPDFVSEAVLEPPESQEPQEIISNEVQSILPNADPNVNASDSGSGSEEEEEPDSESASDFDSSSDGDLGSILANQSIEPETEAAVDDGLDLPVGEDLSSAEEDLPTAPETTKEDTRPAWMLALSAKKKEAKLKKTSQYASTTDDRPEWLDRTLKKTFTELHNERLEETADRKQIRNLYEKRAAFVDPREAIEQRLAQQRLQEQRDAVNDRQREFVDTYAVRQEEQQRLRKEAEKRQDRKDIMMKKQWREMEEEQRREKEVRRMGELEKRAAAAKRQQQYLANLSQEYYPINPSQNYYPANSTRNYPANSTRNYPVNSPQSRYPVNSPQLQHQRYPQPVGYPSSRQTLNYRESAQPTTRGYYPSSTVQRHSPNVAYSHQRVPSRQSKAYYPATQSHSYTNQSGRQAQHIYR
ncbi:hypothetical protein PSACC_01972 [Paramicrosporidium saccamoebae]|uniref:Uncharacterized protein n=1 Tax=Paramicrosporidium saccamoebae TaxID=1246581 RepID=A0A2H9TKD0_9FUNG|nr:hypothetical protein PSACC_01972 [Paramicrosporidium saccamoebae]